MDVRGAVIIIGPLVVLMRKSKSASHLLSNPLHDNTRTHGFLLRFFSFPVRLFSFQPSATYCRFRVVEERTFAGDEQEAPNNSLFEWRSRANHESDKRKVADTLPIGFLLGLFFWKEPQYGPPILFNLHRSFAFAANISL